MTSRLVVSGLAGGLLLASAWNAAAQDAPSGACAGFMCKLFGSKLDDRPTPAPAPTPAQAVAAIPDPADPSDTVRSARKVAKPAAKPIPTVTIAAAPAEAPRLKTLAATMPRTHVRIVAADAAPLADFTAAPAVDGAASGEKARLFTEQLHIVAGSGIHAIADLKGKVVSFGPDKGAAQVAARKAFGALGVDVSETPLDIDNALDGLATGDIAAVVVLAPQPDPRLAKLKSAANLHLLPWPEAAPVPDGTRAASIAGASYPGLAASGDSLRAVGVDVALDKAGRASTNPAAKAFLAALAQHSGALSKRGFDLIKADLDDRASARVASAERR